MDTIKQQYRSRNFPTDGSANISGTVESDPTATNVAGYAYEVKNGATSLGGGTKLIFSNGGFIKNGAMDLAPKQHLLTVETGSAAGVGK